MFSWQHIVWILISAVMVAAILFFYEKKKPPLQKVFTSAVILSVAAELCKIATTITLVSTAESGALAPYLELGRLPLHLCYIQLFLIAYVRFTKRKDRREYVLAFIYPTGIAGGIGAILVPNVFQQISPAEAFSSPLPYWFFPFHAMLIALGVIIVRSGEIAWKRKHFAITLLLLSGMAFATLYLNSLFSSPTYRDGKLISVDYTANFFYTYQNPLGIPFTAIWQWYLYLLGFAAFGTGLLFLFFYPLAFKKRRGVKKDSNHAE